MNFDNSRPIYIQLLEDFKIKISTGIRAAGDKIPPVRSLASEYAVNPNTVQRALAELEREGLCESRRTTGRFVTEDISVINSLSNRAFESFADDFILGMQSLKIDKKKAIDSLDKYWRNHD